MSAAASRKPASAGREASPAASKIDSDASTTGFTRDEDLFFETGKAMEAVMQEDAAAEAWEDEMLAGKRKKGLKPALRIGLVVAAAVGLFVIGGLLVSGESPDNAAARTIAALFH